MRYLVKTYLGNPNNIETSPLDTPWYDGEDFGIHTSAITDKNIYAIWGYPVESVSDDDYNMHFTALSSYKRQPTTLFGTGYATTIWHNKNWDIDEYGDKYRNTIYFFGLEHESIEYVGDCIHGYHWMEYDDILNYIQTNNSYSSSQILWLWNIKKPEDPNNTSCFVSVYNSDTIGTVAYHYIYSNNGRRLSHTSYDDLYNAACSTFQISTLENAMVNTNPNKSLLSSIRFDMGSVSRSFSNNFTTADLNKTHHWRDGMSLMNWGTHSSMSDIQVLYPDDSVVCLFRSGDEKEPVVDASGVTVIDSNHMGISYMNGGAACSMYIGASVNYEKNPTIQQIYGLRSDEIIRYDNNLFRIFNIDQSNSQQAKNKVDQDLSPIQRIFFSDNDLSILERSSAWENDDSSWYQIVVI